MNIAQKNGDLDNQVIYSQAKHSPYYSLLRHETQEIFSIPINPNLLIFNDRKVQYRYFKALYLDPTTNGPSKEFSYNLMTFYIYFTLTAIMLLSSAISLSFENNYPHQFLWFHLAFIISILIYAYICLYLTYSNQFFLNQNRFFFLILGMLWYLYLIIGNQNVLFKIINLQQSENKISFSVAMVSFIYYYRIILFDYHKYIVYIVGFTLITYGMLMVIVSPSDTTEKICEYSLTCLALILQAIESYKVSMNSANIFYRLYSEEERHVVVEEEHNSSSLEFISGSEIAIKKCDNVIKEIINTKRIIIFKEIRDRLKRTISLVSIKKYLGRGEGAEIIGLNDKSQIDEEDKQFIAQNFLNLTKFAPEAHLSRHLTLKDLINRKLRFSYSHDALLESYSQLESLGSDWNFNIFTLDEKIGSTISIIAKHYYQKWSVEDILKVSREIFFRLFENIEIVSFYIELS